MPSNLEMDWTMTSLPHPIDESRSCCPAFSRRHPGGGEEATLEHAASSSSSSSLLSPPPPPPPPQELPLRFLRAGKGDPEEGLRRYEATLQWRKENGVDTILREAFTHFTLIKQHYKTYCHLRGRHNEPCYYEQATKTDLKALEAGGVTVASLVRFYIMVTEYQWQMVRTRRLGPVHYHC